MPDKEVSFEDAFERLEEIADMLESGQPTLEETMALFEEANELHKICSAKLDEAEKRLRILVKEKDELKLTLEED